MYQFRRLLGGKDNASHGGGCLVCNVRSLLHRADRGLNKGGCVLGRFCRFACQAADFTGHHGKSLSHFTGSGGLNSRVQGKNIGLKSDVFYGLDNLADLGGGIIDLIHCRRHLLHLSLSLLQLRSRIHGLFAGHLCVLRIACHMAMYVIDCGCQFLHRSRLLRSPLRQRMSAAGHLIRTAGHLNGAGVYFPQCIIQRVDGILERRLDGGKISNIVHVHIHSQITFVQLRQRGRYIHYIIPPGLHGL